MSVATRFYLLLIVCFLVLFGAMAIAYFLFFFPRVDYRSESEVKKRYEKRYGQFISEFLGLAFPGQYADIFTNNPRLESYYLTEKDRELAVKKLQDTLLNTKEISVECVVWSGGSHVNKYTVSFDQDVVDVLCKQAGLVGETFIPSMLFPGDPPPISITLR